MTLATDFYGGSRLDALQDALDAGVTWADIITAASGGGSGLSADYETVLGKIAPSTPWDEGGTPGLMATTSTDVEDGGWIDIYMSAAESSWVWGTTGPAAGLAAGVNVYDGNYAQMFARGGGSTRATMHADADAAWFNVQNLDALAPTTAVYDVRAESGVEVFAVTTTGVARFTAQTDPAAPTGDGGQGLLYCRDNAGKAQLCVRFPTGAVQVIATEP